MVNFANKGSASVRTTSLAHIAQQVARNSNSRDVLNTAAIPQDVVQSMTDQGMIANSAFSPGQPINPFEPIGSEPQQFEFMIGQNIVNQPRSTESVSFDTMRKLIESYDVAQMCIEARLDQLRNLDWNIVRKDPKDKADYSSEIKKLREFFRKPDGTNLFDDWLNPIANDLISFDSPAIYKEKTRKGALGALQILDGTTITPIIDKFGRQPKSPAPAFIQYTYGMPRHWLTADSVIYRPWRKRSRTVYGFPAVEWLLMNINQDVRQQFYFLQYFTDGSVPDVFAETPESIAADPQKIKDFQRMYDAVMVGDQTQKHKVKWVPAGSKITKMKEDKFDLDYPMLLFNKTLAAFKVTPAELGFTEKVNKSSGESQENVQYRRTIRPVAKYFKTMFDDIIAELGYPHLAFEWENLGEQEDLLTAAKVREIDIRNGVISPDEAAEMAYGITPDANNPTPKVFIFTSGVATVADAIAQGKAQAALTLAQAQMAGNPKTEPQPKEPESNEIETKSKLKELEDVPATKLAKSSMSDDELHQLSVQAMKELVAENQKKLQETIYTFFQTQPKALAKHIVKGLENQSGDTKTSVNKLLESYGWQGWDKHLKPTIYSHLVDTLTNGGVAAAKSVEVNLSYAMINPHAVEYAEKRAGDLVGTGIKSEYHIADSTRDFIREKVTEAVENGTSVQELTDQLLDEYAFSDARALTIARTETALAYNKGTLVGYQKADVPAVTVIDGDSDEECADANGQVWSLDYASDNLIQHPRCVRHFAGITRSEFDGNYDME